MKNCYKCIHAWVDQNRIVCHYGLTPSVIEEPAKECVYSDVDVRGVQDEDSDSE